MQNVAGWSSFGWVTMRRQGGGGIPTANLQVFLDGDDTDGSSNSTRTNGAAFDNWMNKGALGGVFSGASQPLFSSSLLGGHAGATFDGVANGLMSSLPASTFIFLHDGSGATIYSVVRTSTSAVGNIATTSAGASSSVGIVHRYTTGFAAQVVHGGGAAARTTITAPAASVGSGLFDVFASTVASANAPDIGTSVDGASVASGDAVAFTAAAPGSSLMLGASASGNGFLSGDVLCLLVYDVAHDATQRAAVEAALAAKYGVTFPA